MLAPPNGSAILLSVKLPAAPRGRTATGSEQFANHSWLLKGAAHYVDTHIQIEWLSDKTYESSLLTTKRLSERGVGKVPGVCGEHDHRNRPTALTRPGRAIPRLAVAYRIPTVQ